MHYNSEINNRLKQIRDYTYLFQVFTLLDLSFRVSGTWGQAQSSIDRIRLGVNFQWQKIVNEDISASEFVWAILFWDWETILISKH